MKKQINLDYFTNQLKFNENYYKFLCNLYKEDDANYHLNSFLLSSLYEIRYGVCVNPGLIKDLINPSGVKIGKSVSFSPENSNISSSQKKAISKMLAMDNLFILEGPPGTGKTTVIIELIRQLKRKDKKTKILITSQSHIAVDNVMRGFVNDDQLGIELARVKQKDDCAYKEYSETSIFRKIVETLDERLQNIIYSFDNSEDERFGNDFLKYNSSAILSTKSIIGVTCNSIPGCRFDHNTPFDYTIVDEVGKFSFAELMGVAKISKKLILIGDPNQLPAVLKDSDDDHSFNEYEAFDKEGYKYIYYNNYIEDLFNSISRNCKTTLDTQYRMSNAIGNFISQTFYNGIVGNGLDKQIDDALNFIVYSKKSKDEFDKNYLEEEIETENTPLLNEYEGYIIKVLLNTMLKDIPRKDIAIITPYRKQVEMLRKTLPEISGDRISSIDAYQGKEYKYIIYSCTRCFGRSGFLDDRRRVNVAISRAKEKVFVIGNLNYINNHTEYIKSIYHFSNFEINPQSGKKYEHKCKKWFFKNDKFEPQK